MSPPAPDDPDDLCTSLGLLDEPPPPAPARPLSLLLDHLDNRAPFAGFAGRLSRLFEIPEAEARQILAGAASPGGWEPMFPGVATLHFQPGPALRMPGGDAGLVRLAPGTVFPHHQHGGDEHTLVLQGSFVDELTGRRMLPGDILMLPAGSAHRFRIDPGEVCISAVLLLGALSFTR